ncbi:MAG: putative toxin-antitoxin system toxin component, PIN family [Bacteroidota bacterium]
MKIILDTNILLVSVSKKSRYYWIFEAFLRKEYELCVTTDILIEYEEVITEHMGREVANTVLQIIEKSSNVNLVTNYFKWKLIDNDPDDDKFADCAVSGNASYIVSHDGDFKVLRQIDFPMVKVIDIDRFKEILTDRK